MNCSKCGAELQSGQAFCSNCGQPVEQQPAQPMKWYKFISYVQLPLSALIFLVLAVQLMTGAHYQGQADLVYAFFNSLKIVDVIFGLLYLVFAVAAVLICVKMNKKTKDAVKWYLIYLGASVVVSILYIILVYMTTQVFTGTDSIIPTIVVSVVMIVVNKVYFDKRREYFVN